MNSSTFSSETARWRGFLATFLAVGSGFFVLLFAVCVVSDPYDTGRFALLRTPGVPEQGPRTANASRARDPAFDGAIFGNSHLQLVAPDALREATGISFVSLTVPATGPKEQFALIDYFIARRPRPVRALVMGIDATWCTPEAEPRPTNPFPFWLYDPDTLRYLRGLLRYDTIERMTQRIGLVLGASRKPLARPDGYWNYEEHRTWRESMVALGLAKAADPTPVNEAGRFPSLDRLASRLDKLPPEAAVVLVRPPVYKAALSAPGTAQGRADDACRATLARIAEGRPRTALVDWRADRPENHRVENFYDPTHYRGTLARQVERDIATALAEALRPGSR